MPLFMDRHDLPGITAEEVAQAHLLDLAVAPKHGVNFLTYWFDPDSGAAFCLANAAGPADIEAVHRESHGLVPNVIIPVVEDNVLRFLGKIEDPDSTTATTAFRTILFTDLKGSTSLLSGLGQDRYLVLLTEHDLIIRRALVASRGREVKHTGDGIMAAFDDVGRGLACALAIQDAFDARNAATSEPLLQVRIGMAAGEPVDRDHDLFGATVTLASRICDVADAGQILVSEVVQELGAKAGYRFEALGRRDLKGFPEPVPIFALTRQSPP